MSTLIESSKKLEGRVVDGKFTLRQWLGGSDHSAVFLTERHGTEKAAIKLIAVPRHSPNGHAEENRLSRWAVTARISHPNLIRLFEFGRCQIDDERFLFVVMEYAEEDLSQIVPQRQLAPPEVAEMLPAIIEALSFLHEQGLVHGDIKPSNIFAVENRVKVSADSLHHMGERAERKNGIYSAPEAGSALSPASDAWSVGALLIAVLSRQENDRGSHEGSAVRVPEALPEPYRTIARRCLKPNPDERCKLNNILADPQNSQTAAPAGAVSNPKPPWVWVAVLAGILILALLIGRITLHRQGTASSTVPAAPAQPALSQSPSLAPPKTLAQGIQPGTVLHQVQPDVSRQAQKTIHGKLKVTVEVAVDASGKVNEAQLVSAGPSRYFAAKALAAAREWKFTPPQVGGQPSASTWTLRFEFGRASIGIAPKQTKP